VLKIPPVTPSRLAHLTDGLTDEELEQLMAEDPPVKHFSKPSIPSFGLSAPSEVFKTFPQSSATSFSSKY